MMNFINNLYLQIIRVFSDGVFGISLGDLLIIFISIIISLLVRTFVARVLVNKVKLSIKGLNQAETKEKRIRPPAEVEI